MEDLDLYMYDQVQLASREFWILDFEPNFCLLTGNIIDSEIFNSILMTQETLKYT
jgi:hypothetical protein